jgi:hypothetical protein
MVRFKLGNERTMLDSAVNNRQDGNRRIRRFIYVLLRTFLDMIDPSVVRMNLGVLLIKQWKWEVES